MTNEIWLIQSRYEKNADDGVEYFTGQNSRSDMAEAVHESEKLGGQVQVYRCVPVSHEVFVSRVSIDLGDEE